MCILVMNSVQILYNSLRRTYVLIKTDVHLEFYDQLQFLDRFCEREKERERERDKFARALLDFERSRCDA